MQPPLSPPHVVPPDHKTRRLLANGYLEIILKAGVNIGSPSSAPALVKFVYELADLMLAQELS
jgi:hypothetical protein